MRIPNLAYLPLAIGLLTCAPAILAAEPTELQSSAAKLIEADFTADSAAASVAEIEMGKLAKKKSADKAVQAFADQMIADHTAAGEDLKRVASSLGWSVPPDMGPEHRQTYANLEKLSGERFDAAYRLAMVSNHTKAVASFRQQAKFGETPALREFAQKYLPKIEHHLQAAEALPGGQ